MYLKGEIYVATLTIGNGRSVTHTDYHPEILCFKYFVFYIRHTDRLSPTDFVFYIIFPPFVFILGVFLIP